MKINIRRNRNILIAVLLVAAIAVGVWIVQQYRTADEQKQAGGSGQYGPPTEEEKAQAEAHKDAVVDRIQEEARATGNQSDGKRTVQPTITSAYEVDGQVRVMGYVAGLFENGGTCQAMFTKGEVRFTASVVAVPNVSTTDCSFSVNRTELASGEWNIVVSYSSSTAQGVSQAKTLALQ